MTFNSENSLQQTTVEKIGCKSKLEATI